MTIIEYVLDQHPSIPTHKHIPPYVIDGGYFLHPDGSGKRIGIGKEGSIPDSVTTLTLEELQARQRAIHAEHPMMKVSMSDTPTATTYRAGVEGASEEMTDDEVDAFVKEWVDARS